MLDLIQRNTIHYWRAASAGLRRSPDYIIIGAQKAGTTTLFNMLSMHPGVANPKNKEMHFFDHRDISSLRDYRMRFPISPKKITGEATPSYLFYPDVPERLQEEFPSAKLVAVLRNPVDRAFSHYRMRYHRGKEELSFEGAIDAESERMASAYDAYKSRQHSWVEGISAHSYLARGLYAEQLKRWFSVFPSEQLLVMSYERFVENPMAEFSGLCRFLGLSDTGGVKPIHLNSGTHTEMDLATRHRLEGYFREANQELYELLGEDFEWG